MHSAAYVVLALVLAGFAMYLASFGQTVPAVALGVLAAILVLGAVMQDTKRTN